MVATHQVPTGTVTFLLTDVEGSTALWEAHPQSMSDAMAWHDALVEKVAASHRGVVVKARGEGDSQFIVFTIASDAVQTAIAIQRALQDDIPQLPFDLKIRAGLHTGTAEWREGDYYGSVVNRCARIRSLGFGGQTLLSEATASLVCDTLPDGVALVDMGTHRLKGLTRPEKVYQLSIPGLCNDFPPLQSLNVVSNNLPASSTPLIGREGELGKLIELLTTDGTRLVTVTGPGGTGKTRLALAVGSALQEHFRHGVWFVDLAALARPDEIASAIAAAINYQAPDKSGELQAQLLASLSQRTLLLILDNFEHLLGGAALVNEILCTCPDVTILATSRQKLNLASESRFELLGLDFPEWQTPDDAAEFAAVQLFVANGKRIRPDFSLISDNMTDVVRICRLVQGMPLGLLLAATWLELLSPAEIAAEIERSLDFLTAELADLPPRQRSMHAVFEGSWQLMEPEEQTVLARLSVFRGGFTREAAEQVAGATLRTLLALANRSLLQRSPDSDRFSIHEMLRQYAAAQQQAIDPGHQPDLEHCRYFAELVTQELQRALFIYPLNLPTRYGADRDNIRRAWDYALDNGLADELSVLIRGIALFTVRQGVHPTAIAEQAIEALVRNDLHVPETIVLGFQLMEIVGLLGHEDPRVVIDRFMKLLSRVEANGDQQLLYWVYDQMATSYGDLQVSLAIEYEYKARQVALDMGNKLLADAAEARGLWLGTELGRITTTTVVRLREMLIFFEEQYPDSFITYVILCALCSSGDVDGDFERALACGRRAVTIAKYWQDIFWISYANSGLSQTCLQSGRLDEARLAQLDSLDWHSTTGETWQMLGFLWGQATNNPDLFGGEELATTLISMVYHHSEVTPKHKQSIIETNQPALTERLGPEAFEIAWEKGKSLDLDTAVALVRSVLAADLNPES